MAAGRHPYQPSEEDRKRVKRLASFKLPHEEIAKLVMNRQTQAPIHIATLRMHFAKELELGHLDLFVAVADRYACRLTGAKAEVDEVGNIVRAEIVPSERAQEKFLDTFGPKYGWGEQADPLADLDLAKLTDVELSTLKAIVGKARKAAADPGRDRS